MHWLGRVVSALGLWYLPFGTLLSILQIVLLLSPPLGSERICPSNQIEGNN